MKSYIIGFWDGIKNNTWVLIALIVALVVILLFGMYYAAHYGLFEWLPGILGSLVGA